MRQWRRRANVPVCQVADKTAALLTTYFLGAEQIPTPNVCVRPLLLGVLLFERTSKMTTPSASVSHAVPPAPDVHSMWPEAVIALGLGLTAGWVILLGYGMAQLVMLVV